MFFRYVISIYIYVQMIPHGEGQTALPNHDSWLGTLMNSVIMMLHDLPFLWLDYDSSSLPVIP